MTHRDNVLIDLRTILSQQGDLKGKKVLEIGQGNDQQIRGELEALGLVYSATDNYIGVNNGLKRLAGDEYFTDVMEDLKSFQDDTFDFVITVHAFEHCEHPIEALKEMRRVLKDGGLNIIITPNPCKHHIIDKDIDHIMVLSEMQMIRLLIYTGYKGIHAYKQINYTWLEQDWNIFSLGKK